MLPRGLATDFRTGYQGVLLHILEQGQGPMKLGKIGMFYMKLGKIVTSIQNTLTLKAPRKKCI